VSFFEVMGGNRLSGTIEPQGAKNEALQILSAVLLTKEKIKISNIPYIIDVRLLIQLLEEMGVKVEHIDNHTCVFQADAIDIEYLTSPEFQQKAGKLRGSVMITGPLLARFKKAIMPKPGGDKIGRRKLDTHIKGFERLGAKFSYEGNGGYFTLTADKLEGKFILLDEPSVTGTANVVMAAVLAEGETSIYNAACEPYVQQLCAMLNRMGAKIHGIGSNLLFIEGVKELKGTEHTMLPDMIEIGSFIGMAAMTQSELTIKNASIGTLGVIPEKFQQIGIKLEFKGDDIYIPAQDVYEIHPFYDGTVLTIYDHPWPGFTPDLLSIILVVATQAKGNCIIHQKMFESRLFFVDKLIEMGAQVVMCDPHRVAVIGWGREHQLRGITMTSPDIRAGIALLIAALSARGKSTIQNIEQIDRGYQFIDQRLQSLGADIVRKN
jgi:UDP-N-acetylglucosamine 1-carboxyvinyltransferase